jgi:hypothetical protein
VTTSIPISGLALVLLTAAVGDSPLAVSPVLSIPGWRLDHGAVRADRVEPVRCAATAVSLGEAPSGDSPEAALTEYYDFALIPTEQVPGIGRAYGTGKVTFQSSPFGVAIGADGSYLYDAVLSFPGLRPPGEGALTVWFTTPSLDRIERKGVLTGGAFEAPVAFNKFLVVVTLEPTDDPDATMWRGPIVSRGMSRSGLMHTMAGHGPYETENCAAYGYGP